MTTRPETSTKGRSSSITEYGPNEINRTTREKGIKTLQDIRKDNIKANNLAADNVKDFLQDTNTSFSSEDGKLPNDAHRLEKRIIKQQYLVNNKLFDPTEYFGGLDISNLGEHPNDQRLEDMFTYYLPTEAEEREAATQPIVKQTQSDKPQTKSPNPPKQFDLAKSTWSAKDKGPLKTDIFKSPTKEFPETAKAGKEVIDFEPLSPLSSSHAKMHSNFKKEFGQNLLNKTKNPVKAKTVCQTVATVVQEYKPVVIAHKKKKSTGLSDKENKVDEREMTSLRAKKSASVSKKPGSSENSKRTISGVDSNSFVPKSANTSLSRNNRSTVQDGHHNYSLNTTAKINLSQHAGQKAELDRKFNISEKTSAKDDPSQRLGSTKTDTQSTGRSKTKSSDQTQTSQNLRRNRKGRKNFSSFNNTLTTEDEQPEFLFKSFNTLTRPQTSQTVTIDDNNYVLKGILSPTVTKSLVSKGLNSTKSSKNNQKAGDKPQPVNPLKFLNDLLNKRKISAGSSDHLRMPKKPTFLENKAGSPVAQIGPKHAKTPSKSDLFEARITNQVNKKAQGVSASNYASANSFKNLFTLKGFEK